MGSAKPQLARSLGEVGHELLLGDLDAVGLRVVDASIRALVAQGVERMGAFDVIFANAGIAFPEGVFSETSDSTISTLLDINLLGTILLLRASLLFMRNGGSVILTGSTSGMQAHPGAAVYSATKMAIVGLGRSLALELAPRRIRVNIVCPGGVDTPLARHVAGPDADAAFARYEDMNPLGRIATPEDVASVVCFLASPAARHVNGVALRVDGGDCLLGAV